MKASTNLFLEKSMKMIRWALMPLLLMSCLFLVFVTRGQEKKNSSLVTREKVKTVSLTWVRVAPANEEFTASMPDAPKVETEKLVVSQKPILLAYYGLMQDDTQYAVLSVSGLQDKMADLAHILMLNFYSKLIRTSLLYEPKKYEVGMKATYERGISLNGYTGREYSIQARNSTGFWRVYRVGKKFYAVTALTTRKDKILPDRFLNSFTFPSSTLAVIHRGPVQPAVKVDTQRPPALRSSSGSWLIILKTFSKAEHSKADETMSHLRSLGCDAHLVDTDHYPNLRKGFLAVTMGPYSKSTAEGVLQKMRSVAPGSYIKSGW
jgi:hypothetical protein